MDLITIISGRQDIIDFCKKVVKAAIAVSILDKIPQNITLIQGTVFLDAECLSAEELSFLKNREYFTKTKVIFILKKSLPDEIIEEIYSQSRYILFYPCHIELARSFYLRYKEENSFSFIEKSLIKINPTQKEEQIISKFEGKSEISQRIRAKILHFSKDDSPVLILGETGTGKTMIAELIHMLYCPNQKKLEKINSSTLNSNFVDTQLFGNVVGAYTDAQDRAGILKKSNNGVLFFDEIGTLSLESQAKLLSVLDDGVIYKVGSDHNEKLKIKFIFATNDNLKLKIMEGNFRKDFYYRIASNVIEIPSLRERPDDIPVLAKKFAKDYGVILTEDAIQKLQTNYWGGNVRELKNYIKSSIIYAKDGILSESDLDFQI